MICANCNREFKGVGNYCPECQSSVRSLPDKKGEFNSVTQSRRIYPASIFWRTMAFLFDSICLGFISQLVFLGLSTSFAYLLKLSSHAIAQIALSSPGIFVMFAILGQIAVFLVYFTCLAGISLLYYALFESSRLQGTPGKLLTGLIVTDARGERPSIWRAMGRVMMRYIGLVPIMLAIALALTTPAGAMDAIPATLLLSGLAILIFTYPIFIFTYYNQGLHDLLSRCIVQEGDGRSNIGILVVILTVGGVLTLAYQRESNIRFDNPITNYRVISPTSGAKKN